MEPGEFPFQPIRSRRELPVLPGDHLECRLHRELTGVNKQLAVLLMILARLFRSRAERDCVPPSYLGLPRDCRDRKSPVRWSGLFIRAIGTITRIRNHAALYLFCFASWRPLTNPRPFRSGYQCRGLQIRCVTYSRECRTFQNTADSNYPIGR